ncbi:hypothetical protein FACS1894133_1090 [Clostridia bacterium]|nr:hypothetical protein FACS1894133_1090 [Clostridia bacterium]
MHIDVVISLIAEITKILIAVGNIASVILVVEKLINNKRQK